MNYEILCLISPHLEEKDISSTSEKIEEIIKNLQGNVSYMKNLGQKKLTYPIKHEKKAYYLAFYFALSPSEIKNFEEKLRNLPEILRYQIIKTRAGKIKEEKIEEKIEEILKIS